MKRNDAILALVAIFGLTLLVSALSAFGQTGMFGSAFLSGEVIDAFAETSGGSAPAVLEDYYDSTWVRGGLGTSNADYIGVYTTHLGNPSSLGFYAKVECLSGACGDYEGCAYYFKIENMETGGFEDIGSIWTPAGLSEKTFEISDFRKYIDAYGDTAIKVNFECNMDGKLLELAPILGSETTGSYESDYVGDSGTAALSIWEQILRFFQQIFDSIMRFFFDLLGMLGL